MTMFYGAWCAQATLSTDSFPNQMLDSTKPLSQWKTWNNFSESEFWWFSLFLQYFILTNWLIFSGESTGDLAKACQCWLMVEASVWCLGMATVQVPPRVSAWRRWHRPAWPCLNMGQSAPVAILQGNQPGNTRLGSMFHPARDLWDQRWCLPTSSNLVTTSLSLLLAQLRMSSGREMLIWC